MPSIGDIVVIAVLAVIVFFCVRSIIKAKKNGGCSGNCSSCGGSCSCGSCDDSEQASK